MNKHRTIEAMRQHGGSFVRALAEAWIRGDELNRQKIEAAWRETWLRYEAMAAREGMDAAMDRVVWEENSETK